MEELNSTVSVVSVLRADGKMRMDGLEDNRGELMVKPFVCCSQHCCNTN